MNKVAGYRKMLGLSQKEMGKILGVTQQSYWNKENGRTAFNDKEKLKIKNMLLEYFPNITIDNIFF